jgi:hypothetical protein
MFGGAWISMSAMARTATAAATAVVRKSGLNLEMRGDGAVATAR